MQDSLRILYNVVFLFWLLCVSNFCVFRVLWGCFEINLCIFLVERPFTQSFPLILLMSCFVLCCPEFVALPLSYPLFFFSVVNVKVCIWKNSFAMLHPPKKNYKIWLNPSQATHTWEKETHTPPCSSAELFPCRKNGGHGGKISVVDMAFLVFIGFCIHHWPGKFFIEARKFPQASQRKGLPPGKSGKLPEKSGELPGRSGKLPGNLWIAVIFHSERTSGEVAEKLSGEVWGTSGEVRGPSRSSGEPDSLPATRQTLSPNFWVSPPHWVLHTGWEALILGARVRQWRWAVFTPAEGGSSSQWRCTVLCRCSIEQCRIRDWDGGGQNVPNARGGGTRPESCPWKAWPRNWGFSIEPLDKRVKFRDLRKFKNFHPPSNLQRFDPCYLKGGNLMAHA